MIKKHFLALFHDINNIYVSIWIIYSKLCLYLNINRIVVTNTNRHTPGLVLVYIKGNNLALMNCTQGTLLATVQKGFCIVLPNLVYTFLEYGRIYYHQINSLCANIFNCDFLSTTMEK